ncbi:MAG: GSCFA domain-containing protein, partial [Bacteroidota bacterium]
MAKLSTLVPIPDYPFQIAHQQQVLSMGSCFAEHMGGYLERCKFQHLLNPFGIVYHPLVMARLLRQLLDDQRPNVDDLFEQQGLWRHYDFHSRYAQSDATQAAESLRQQHRAGAQAVRQLDVLILTLGTAYGYQLRSTTQWVNNCHKQPANSFEKQVAEVPEMVQALTTVLRDLKQVNPKLQVIITVSPVRHLRDGLLENQRSKARLLLTQETLCAELDFVHYFPSYEILLDELRDYRFYADDLLHPSMLAIEVITERFAGAFMSEQTLALSQQVQRIVEALLHRPLHPESNTYRRFRKQTQQRIDALQEKYPFLD